ncbi:SusD family protein [Chryseobacterium taichungense]|uniref:SusD family protein n=1 Tax=Chryseobacterium taichungense TaxID=295069 RepID=A0A1H7ZFI9_9FLAO|nr:RagB/SusD family nutrient uptake outer membrane protein [Chryseobacterium taichungense]SEM57021.1 SusD family protein [Chryseobacterium taichungense]
MQLFLILLTSIFYPGLRSFNSSYTLYTALDSLAWTQDTGLQGGFNDLNTNSWIWGFDIQIVNGLDLVSWWGQVDRFTYSYASAGDYKGMDNNLYSSISTDDARRSQFQFTVRIPTNKFYDSKRVVQGQRQITADYLYMRVDEYYLLAAETLAKSGQETEARTILKTLLDNRYNNPTTTLAYIDALSGVNLQNEIYKQTRIELWGEGKSYLALKRNKATVVRGSNHLFLVGTPLPYNDPRMYFKIPQREIDDNPNF